MEHTFAVRETIGGLLSPSVRAVVTQLARSTQLLRTYQWKKPLEFPISAIDLLEMVDIDIPDVPRTEEIATASDPNALRSSLARLAATADVVGNHFHRYLRFVKQTVASR